MRNLIFKSLYLLVCLVFTLNFNSTFAQETCATATAVPSLTGAPCAVGNAGTVDDMMTPALCASSGTFDAFFSFVAQGPNATVSVTASAAGFRPEFVILESDDNTCTGAFTYFSANCFDLTGNYTAITGAVTLLVPGKTYWIMITSGKAVEITTGTLTVCVTNPAPPANDLCSGVQVTTPDGTCYTGTTEGASDDLGIFVAPDNFFYGCQTTSNPEVWYSFVSTGTTAAFTVTNGTMTGNVEIVLLDATCTDGVLNSSCGASPYVYTFSGLTAGNTYYYTISSSTGVLGTFTTCVTTSTPVTVSGQDCSSAAIVCNMSTISESPSVLGFGTQEVNNVNSCLAGGENQSKWYKFTAGNNGTFEFNINPNVWSDDYDWAVWDITTLGCPSLTNIGQNALACNWDGVTFLQSTGMSSCANICASEPDALDCSAIAGCQPYCFENWTTGTYTPLTLVAGHTYVLLVDNYDLANSGYTLTFGGACGGGTLIMGPDAAFTYAIGASCGAFDFTKTNATTNSTFAWTFGDGSTSALENPSHTYAIGGSYNVTLVVTDALGCSTTTNQTLTVPISDAGSDIAICSGVAGSIGAIAVGGYTYLWSPTTGLSSSVAADPTVTLSNLTSAATTAIYTLTTTSGGICTTDAVTVTINPAPTGTFSYTGTPYCINGTDPLPTFSGTGVAGTFSSTAGLVFVNTATGEVDLSASTAGAYTVTNSIAAASGCPATSASSAITITSLPVATFSYTGTPYCSNGADPLPSFSGSGVAGTFSSTAGLVFISTATGEVDLSASSAGTYTITNTIAAASGCSAVVETANITITAAPVATFSYTGSPYCSNGSDPLPTFGGGGVAGSFTSTAGLSINAVSGLVDLSASIAGGPYTVTNTIAAAGGCLLVSATSPIAITAPLDATFNYGGSTFCQTGSNLLVTLGAGAASGVYSSTAGIVFVSTATGEIDILASTLGGPYTITNTLAAVGACPIVTATTLVTITLAPDATFTYALASYCENGTDPLPVFGAGASAGVFSSTVGLVFVNPSTGEIDLSASIAGGPYTVTNTIAAAGGCPLASATSPITIAAQAVGTFNYGAATYCSSAVDPSPVFTGGGVAGVFSSTVGLAINTASGIIDLSASTAGNYTVTNTIAAVGACPQGISTFPLVITAAPIGTFSYLATPYCSNGVDPSPTFSGGGVAGLFSSTAGLIINASSGIVDLSASTAGTYTVTNTIAAASGCPAVTSTSSITITALPVGTFSYVGTPFCSNGVDPAPVFSVGAVAGVFGSTVGLSINSASGLVDLSASAAGTYTVTNTIAAASGCPAVTPTSIITITALPIGTFSYTASPYCSDGVDPSPTFSGGGVAGVFGSTAGLSINVASGLIDLSASTAGTYTVTNTIAAASGCPASAPTSSITITALPIGTFSYVASPYCSTGVDPLPTYSGGGVAGTFSGTAGLVINAATGLVDLGASTAGTFTVTNTISAAAGCPLVAPISTITITSAVTGLFSYISTPYCSDAVNPLPTFSGGGVGGVFSSTAGLVINGASGLVDLSACVPGTYTVTNTIAAFAGCPAITPTSSITVTALPTGVFSYVDSPYCTDGINPIPVVGAGSTAGTYSSTAGLTINPANGEVDLGLSAPATYVVTNSIAAAAGCPIVLTTSNIVINGIPAAPSVSADATYCSFTSPSDIVAIAGGGGTITWYSDVTLLDSIGSGLTFTPITTVGTNNYYVTETVSGCESPASLSIQVVQFCDIEIPTAFTPDGDLVNDSWELKFIDEVFTQNQVKIYNRWGNLIFESSKGQYETKPFNGTFNGDQLPVSSYYYIIEYNDGTTENATGTVTIVRK